MKKVIVVVIVTLALLGCIGWVKDVIKLVRSDFNAPYKAEIMYGIGAVTGLGAVIGWIDIKD